MQLRFLFFLGFFTAFNVLSAQADVDSSKIHLEDVTIDFLFNYYEQDGNHSPVTGGQGTESLTNTAPSLLVNIPIDTNRYINYNGGVDYYTTASSDNINNPYLQVDHVSSASASDFRMYSNVGYKQMNGLKNTSYAANLGVSFEFDVSSVSVGAAYAKSSKDKNKEFSIKGSYFFDSWKLIYPIEHRNGTTSILDNDQRHSVSLSLVESWVMNKRMNASVNVDLVMQQGLLSTPFHRVYFNDYNQDEFGNLMGDTTSLINSQVEQLPNTRFKIPIGVRWNYYLADFMRVNLYYRFYYDTWNVLGNTAQIELPLLLTKYLRVYPFYRFHHQTAADYFAPFAVHDGTAPPSFFTSDFDLSGFTSHRMGLGISIAPLFGIFNFTTQKKGNKNMLKSIDLRYSHYRRSDGLVANLYSLGLSYAIKR